MRSASSFLASWECFCWSFPHVTEKRRLKNRRVFCNEYEHAPWEESAASVRVVESVARQEWGRGLGAAPLQAADFGKAIPSAAPGGLNLQKVFKALRGRRLSSALLSWIALKEPPRRGLRSRTSAWFSIHEQGQGGFPPRSRQVYGLRCFPLPPAPLSRGRCKGGPCCPQAARWGCSTWPSTMSQRTACCWPGSPPAVPPATGSPG